ncbi:MAG: (2Fe-2S)-binding protein, partial [Pseudomonadota bacterium]
MFEIKVNGETRQVDVDEDTPVLWVVRDELKLMGTKFGCGVAACGACTVHVDGSPTRSCQLRVADAVGLEITTIEGLQSAEAKAVQAAWQKHDVVQCGFCQSGQIMAASALLAENSNPSDE